MGATVVYRAELVSVADRRAQFNVSAMMGEKVIGEGTHQRAIIEVKRFKQRVGEG
jgi:fluoroacetyl-CoA thioesterase